MTTVALNFVQEKANRLVDEQRVHVLVGERGRRAWDRRRRHRHLLLLVLPGLVGSAPVPPGKTHRDCSHALALEWLVWRAAPPPTGTVVKLVRGVARGLAFVFTATLGSGYVEDVRPGVLTVLAFLIGVSAFVGVGDSE